MTKPTGSKSEMSNTNGRPIVSIARPLRFKSGGRNDRLEARWSGRVGIYLEEMFKLKLARSKKRPAGLGGAGWL